MADPEASPGPDPAQQGRRERRDWLMRGRVLRLLALSSVAALLVLAHLSAVPWLAHGFALLALVFIITGWRDLEPADLLRTDPVRAQRPIADLRLHRVLDSLPSPVILVDHRGHVVFANAPAIQAFSGMRIGYPVSFAVRAPALLEAVELVLRGETETRLDFVERVPLERRFDVFIRALRQPEIPPEHGVGRAVIVMTDTTAARRLEAMRVDFVANASHELRTPLASILGFVETLQGAARDDAQARKTFLPIMETQARRMARLIDDLLSLSKIEMNEHVPPADPVDLPLLLRSVFDALGGLARDRGVQLALVAPEGLLPVLGDRDELVRVFENLVENAIKYGQSGGKVDVSMEAGPQDPARQLTVHIRDYGPGIAAEHLPRLTERFYRADVAESRVLGGTGLGLAIVKHIVTRHRGRLAIASAPGQGATFSVTLPAFQEKSQEKTNA